MRGGFCVIRRGAGVGEMRERRRKHRFAQFQIVDLEAEQCAHGQVWTMLSFWIRRYYLIGKGWGSKNFCKEYE